MRPSFHPRLINGPFDDPGLLIPFIFENRSILFDLGDLGGLSTGEILKISHIFVSHTHMDHFIGFDRLLRLLLGRKKEIHLYGPLGFLSNVVSKLRGYTWNLVDNYKESLHLTLNEIRCDTIVRQTASCRNGFATTRRRNLSFKNNLLCDEQSFQVHTAILDHDIPCLGFCIEERFHINILKTGLSELNLEVGPWISRFKRKLLAGADPSERFEISFDNDKKNSRQFNIGELASRISHITPGQKVGYITDVALTEDNRRKIVALVEGCDHLYIEAAFLDAEHDIAKKKGHLTARQAGEIARLSGAKQMTVFHFSPRYSGNGHLLEDEARRAFSRSRNRMIGS
jgi:ribonuclease Z